MYAEEYLNLAVDKNIFTASVVNEFSTLVLSSKKALIVNKNVKLI